MGTLKNLFHRRKRSNHFLQHNKQHHGKVLVSRSMVRPMCMAYYFSYFCFLGENEPASLQSSSTFLLRPNQRKSPSQTLSPCTRRLGDARGRLTASSKARACPRGAGVGGDFEGEAAVVDGAGEEEDFRLIICSRTIHTHGSSETVLFKLRAMYSSLTFSTLQGFKLFMRP